MARVHDVDPAVDRADAAVAARPAAGRRLVGCRRATCSTTVSARDMGELARLGATAYVAWAVFDGGNAQAESPATREFLLAHRPEAIDDPYVLALVANALLAMDPGGMDAAPLSRPAGQRETVVRRRKARRGGIRPPGGPCSTAPVAAAASKPRRWPPWRCCTPVAIRLPPAVRWRGSSASATAAARGTRRRPPCWRLKALLAGTGKPLERRPAAARGNPLRREARPRPGGPGRARPTWCSRSTSRRWSPQASTCLTITDRSDTAAVYQVSLRYHLPQTKEPAGHEGLSIELAYDKTDLSVNDTVGVTATVVNKTGEAAPMVILDLPIPAGFAMVSEDLEKLVAAEAIAKYQLTPRSAIVYLRQLSPDEPLVLHYRLQATMPVKVTVPPARAYEYYDPDKQVSSTVAHLTATAAK